MDAMHEANAKELLGFEPLSRRLFVAGGLLATGFAASVRPVSAQAIMTDSQGLAAGEIKVKASDREIPGYAAMPATGGNFPVVLVVSEIWGVHAWVQDMCRRFAKAGYMAVAVEHFVRYGDVAAQPNIQEVIKIVGQVPDAQVMTDLDAAVAWAAASGKADMNKLAITGYCWGGRVSWLYAAHNPNVKAAMPFYGRVAEAPTPNQPANALSKVGAINATVMGFYGGADQGIPVADVEKIRDAMRAAGKKVEIVIYPDAPHAFMADYRPSYRKEVAEDAWKKALAFLKANGI